MPCQLTPVQLQRVGRTGRKRDGTVHVLLAAGREERNWDKAVDAYEAVQTFIVKAEHLELYDDVERMIPTHIKPECVELMTEIEPYVREEPKPRKGSPSKPAPKRKKDRDVERNIPAGALKGFISASKLKPKKRTEFDPSGCESDEEDKELEAGIFGPRRTVSLTAKDSMKQKKPRRATTIAGASSRKGKSKAKANEEPIRAQQTDVLEIEDDSDDQSIQKGLFNSKKRSRSPLKTPPRRSKRAEPMPMSSPEVPLVDEISDLVTPGPSYGTVTESQTLSIPSSSPELPLLTNTSHQSGLSCKVATASSATSKLSTTQPKPDEEDPDEDDDMAWLVAADSSPDIRLVHSSPMNIRRSPRISDRADSEEIVEDSEPVQSLCGSPRPLTPTEPSSPSKAIHDDVRMPPPALPTRFLGSSPKDSLSEMPEPTFAVRPLGKNPRKRLLVKDSDSSPAMPPLSQRRLQRHQSPPSPIPNSPPPKRRKRLFKDAAEVQKHNPWVELEASHSGDEKDIGSSDVEDVANASDLQFVDELPETQVSPSYNQTAIYRQSLLTQVPGRNPGGPVFSKQPARRGANWFKESASPRQTVSSPSRTEAASDDYVLGSFVVDDEADISYTDDT